MIRAVSLSSRRCMRSTMMRHPCCSTVAARSFFALLSVDNAASTCQLGQRKTSQLLPNHHHQQQQQQHHQQQQRSLSTFQRLVDVVLQRPNPIVETIKQQLDNDTQTSSPSLPNFSRMEPRHFQSAATQIQMEYDQSLQELEQHLLQEENVTYDSVIPILAKAEIPMTFMTNYLQLYYQLQKDPMTQHACAMASNVLMFHHDNQTTTSKTIPNALERIYKDEVLLNHNNDDNNREHISKLEYWLQRYNININNNDSTSNEDKDNSKEHTLESIQATTKELETKFITYMEDEESNKGGSASKSKWSTRDKIQDIYHILALKRQEAQLGGYEHHVDQVFQTQKSRMAVNVQQIQELHDSIQKEILDDDNDSSSEDNKYLQDMDTKSNNTTTAKNTTTKDDYDNNKENDMELKTYLTLDGVLGGLFGLSRALFGLNIKEEEDKVQAWHPEVRLFHVYDTDDDSTDDDSYVGSFYIDPYRRPLKSYRPMTGVLVKSAMAAKPVVYMNVTIKPPVWDHMPTDVTLDDTVTLFHEFGHVLQLLLSGGGNIPLDVEEVIPQFMEHWVYEESILQSLAHLSQSTEKIPSDLLTHIVRRRSSQKKYELLERLFISELELAVFSAAEEDSIVALQKQMAEKYMSHTQFAKSDISPLMDVMMHNVVTGKSVGHYRYVWGEVMSADLFHVFQQGGLSNKDHIQTKGRQFRSAFLDLGSTENNDFATRFHEFRGRTMSSQTMLDMYGLSKISNTTK